MNRDRAKELLPIVQAYAEGKTIQLKVIDEWCDISDPNFAGFDARLYRIKPEEVSSIKTVRELDEELRKKISDIAIKGDEDEIEVKLTLSEDMVRALEKRYSWLLPVGKFNEYMGIPFEVGEKTTVEIVKIRHYRPFKDCDELIATWAKMMGYKAKENTMPLIWVRSNDGTTDCISSYGGKHTVGLSWFNKEAKDIRAMFDNFTFLDGSPFGVKEE